MDLWRWAPVSSDTSFSAGSSTSVNLLSDRSQLAATNHFQSSNVILNELLVLLKNSLKNVTYPRLTLHTLTAFLS